MTTWLFAFVACSSVSVEGTLVDGISGAPVPGPKVITAKAVSPDATMGCQFLSGDVGADGTFSVSGLCGGTKYELDLDDDSWWLADGSEVPDGGFPGPTKLAAFKVPKGAGLYIRAADGAFEELKTAGDLKSEKLFDSDTRVKYPAEIIEEHVPVLVAGQHLVLVGKSVVDEMTFQAVVPSGARKFDGGKGPPAGNTLTINMAPWMYLSARFVDDKTIEKVEPGVDLSKAIVKRQETRAVEWIPFEAMQPGRLSVMREGDRRMYLVDVGAKLPKPPPAPAPAP
jgi:hypothetical protein